MGKLLRILAYIAGALVLLVVLAVILIPIVVDPNDFRQPIAEAVESRTGRTLDIQGDLELSVFPWLGIDIGPTRLSNAPGFSDRPFASVEAVEIRVKLLPLLRKQLEMDTLVLEGLKLSLETNASGKTNWEDLAGAEAKGAEKKVEEEPGEGAPPLASLAIGGIEISDASVIWDDRKTGARYDIVGLGLRTGAIAPGETVPVEMKMALKSVEPPVSGPVTLKARVTLSEDASRIEVADARLDTDLNGSGLPGGELKAGVGFDTVLDMKAQQLDLTGLVISALGLDIRGEVHGKDLFGDAIFDGNLKIGEFSPRDTLKALGQPQPETSDPKALTSADGGLKLAATTNSVRITDLRFRLDDTHLDGDASVQDFAKPAIRFDLNVDGIDVDRYLPPPAEEPAGGKKGSGKESGGKPAAATPGSAGAAAAELIPVEPLRALDVEGKVNIGKLKVANLRSQDIIIQLKAKDGLVHLAPLGAKLYEGRYKGNVQIDVRGKQPKISLNEKINGLQVGPLLKDMTGEDRLTGTAKFNLKVDTRGQTETQLKKNLNGKTSFAFLNGVVKGFNLAAILRKARAQLKGKPVPKETGPNETDFSEITGSGIIRNGELHNEDLKASSPLLRLRGKGSVDLVKEKLNYLVTVKVVDTLKGQGGKDLKELQGLSIPIKINGTFAEPGYKVKLDKLLKDNAEKEIRDKASKKLEKKFGKDLKGLFN